MTNQDLVNHREYVEELISRYSQYIDEYKFDEFKHIIYIRYSLIFSTAQFMSYPLKYQQ